MENFLDKVSKGKRMSLIGQGCSPVLQGLRAGMGGHGAARDVEDSEKCEAKNRKALVPVSYRKGATQI